MRVRCDPDLNGVRDEPWTARGSADRKFAAVNRSHARDGVLPIGRDAGERLSDRNQRRQSGEPTFKFQWLYWLGDWGPVVGTECRSAVRGVDIGVRFVSNRDVLF